MPYTAVESVQSHLEEDSSSAERTHLHRGLSPFMNFAFGFTEVGVLSSICVVFGHGLSLGGTATFFWAYFLNFIVTILTGYARIYVRKLNVSKDLIISVVHRYSMAELCAAYPSAGACYQVDCLLPQCNTTSSYTPSYLYQWAGQVAPRQLAPLMSVSIMS